MNEENKIIYTFHACLSYVGKFPVSELSREDFRSLVENTLGLSFDSWDIVSGRRLNIQF